MLGSHQLQQLSSLLLNSHHISALSPLLVGNHELQQLLPWLMNNHRIPALSPLLLNNYKLPQLLPLLLSNCQLPALFPLLLSNLGASIGFILLVPAGIWCSMISAPPPWRVPLREERGRYCRVSVCQIRGKATAGPGNNANNNKNFPPASPFSTPRISRLEDSSLTLTWMNSWTITSMKS